MALYTANNRRLNQIIHSSKGATYTVGLVTVFVLALMLLLAILPAYKSITDQIENNKTKTSYLQDLNTKKDAMDQLLTQYDQNAPLIDTFNEYNLTRNNNELIITNLDEIANNNKVQLLNATFGKTAAPVDKPYNGIADLQAQDFNYSLKGSLAGLHDFLAYLENFPVIMNIKTISYSHGTDSFNTASTSTTQDPNFSMDLSGVYYFWNVPQQQ